MATSTWLAWSEFSLRFGENYPDGYSTTDRPPMAVQIALPE
jgi:hypothetical protein